MSGSFSSSWGRIPLHQVRCWRSRACCVFEAAKCAELAMRWMRVLVAWRPVALLWKIPRITIKLRTGWLRKDLRQKL